jgi:hypothetical protein
VAGLVSGSYGSLVLVHVLFSRVSVSMADDLAPSEPGRKGTGPFSAMEEGDQAMASLLEMNALLTSLAASPEDWQRR